MGDFNETTRILNAESQEQLTKARDAELKKILKLRFVLAQLRRLNAKNMDLVDAEPVDWAIKTLGIRNYLRLNNEHNDCLLNLDQCRSITISYTESKAVRQHLIKQLHSACQPIVDFGRKMRSELPELFTDSSSSSSHNSSSTSSTGQDRPSKPPFATQLQELELQRRETLLKLVEVLNRKCAYLKAAAELKMGPYLTHELELLNVQANLRSVKALLLRSYLINEFISRSDHSLKAIKEVEHFIDEALEKA